MAEVHPACPQPCKECPWRVENQGKRHAHGFYTLANLRRLWAGLRRGERMTCHPTDPRMVEFSGYETTAEASHTHECTGSLILVQRELMRFQKCASEAEAEGQKNAYKRYRTRCPKGLMRDGLLETVARTMFGGTMIDRLAMALPDLNTPGIGHPDLPDWEPRKKNDA